MEEKPQREQLGTDDLRDFSGPRWSLKKRTPSPPSTKKPATAGFFVLGGEGGQKRTLRFDQLAYASWNVIGHADDGPQAARSRRARRNAPSNPSPAAIARLVESAPATAGFSLFGGECLPDATELGPATAVPSLRKLPASGCSCAITERDFACDSAQAFPRGKLFEFEVHPEHAR